MAEYRIQAIVGVALVVVITLTLIAISYLPLQNTQHSSTGSLSTTFSSSSNSSSTTSFSHRLNLVTTIQVLGRLSGIAFDSSNGYLYAVTFNAIIVINGRNNSVVSNLALRGPAGIIYDPSNGYLYVTCYDGANYSAAVIDGSSNSVIKYVPGGCGGSATAYDSFRHLIYVFDGASDGIAVINDSTNAVLTRVPIGGPAIISMTYDPSNGDIYAAELGGSVVVINGSNFSVIADISLERGNVSIITLGGIITMGGIAYDPANKLVYVTIDNNIAMINGSTNTVIGSFPYDDTGGFVGFGYDPISKIFYVPEDTNMVDAIDASSNQALASVHIGKGITQAVYDSANGDVYAADAGSASVFVLSTS